MFRWVRSLGADLPDDFAHEVAVIMSAGAGWSLKLIYVATGWWPQFLVSWASPWGFLSVFMTWYLTYTPEQVVQKCKQGVSPDAFCDLVLEVAHGHFRFILFVRSKSSTSSSARDFWRGRVSKNLWSYFKSPVLKKPHDQEETSLWWLFCGEIKNGRAGCVEENLGWKLAPCYRM